MDDGQWGWTLSEDGYSSYFLLLESLEDDACMEALDSRMLFPPKAPFAILVK